MRYYLIDRLVSYAFKDGRIVGSLGIKGEGGGGGMADLSGAAGYKPLHRR